MDVYSLSGELAKYGVNVLDIKYQDGVILSVLYEFRWRPRSGQGLWTKSVLFCDGEQDGESIIENIIRDVQTARIAVEGGGNYE